MANHNVDEFDYMAEEHEVDDIVDEVDEDYYARDDDNIEMDDYEAVCNLFYPVAVMLV